MMNRAFSSYRERGLSSWARSSLSSDEPAALPPAISSRDAAEETWTWADPSWVLSRRSAVFAAVSFSNVTVADWADFSSPDSGVTEREWILPLEVCQRRCWGGSSAAHAYQKLKKSRTSFSLVCPLMPLTWTVLDMVTGAWI